MWKVFKVLGFLIGWFSPFGVVYVNHVALVEGGYSVDMLGLIIVLAILVGFVKWVDKRVEIWDIQDKNKVFRLVWTNSKKILIAIGLTWVLYTIEDDIKKIQVTGLLITLCLVVGFVFSLLGELKKPKMVSK